MKFIKCIAYTGIFALCGALAPQSAYADSPTQAKVKPICFTDGPTIRVLLEHSINSALLEVKGPYKVLRSSNATLLSFGTSKRFVIYPMSNGLRWGEEYPDINQITIVPEHKDTTIYVDGIQYKGAINIYRHKTKISVVNEVDIEDYIKSTLAAEFTSPLSKETMAALAIAARTNAYYQLIAHPSDIWHVSAQEVSYQGYGVTGGHNGIDEAVDCTRHMVMENVAVEKKDTKMPATFATTWSENNAGKIAPFHVVFKEDKDAPKDAISSPLASKARDAVQWSFSLSKDELAAICGLAKVDQIALNTDKESGKVQSLRFKSGQNSKEIDFFTFQEEVGKERLQSNDFKTVVTNTGVKFSGYGKGCGVGLCLYTAEQMAQKGHDARRILYTFYPNTKITAFNNPNIR